MDEQDWLAAIGRVAVNAAALEWWIAILISVTEGGGFERARAIASKTGEAMRQLEALTKTDPRLTRLCSDARSALDYRHVLAHSVTSVIRRSADADFIWLSFGKQIVPQQLDEEMVHVFHPRSDSDSALTLNQLRRHAELLNDIMRRVVIAVEFGTYT